jgi:hypothetical protein
MADFILPLAIVHTIRLKLPTLLSGRRFLDAVFLNNVFEHKRSCSSILILLVYSYLLETRPVRDFATFDSRHHAKVSR